MKKAIALLTALVLIFSLASFALADALSDIKARGELIVGSNVAFPPYEFYFTDPETGREELAGFDMMLAKNLADLLGVRLTVVDQTFAGLITALRSGDIDMIIAGLTIGEGREEVVDFSDAYYADTQALLIRKEDDEAFSAPADTAGKIIAAQMGTLQATILDEQFASAQPMVMDAIPLMVLDLVQGSIDGILLDRAVALSYAALHPDKLCVSRIAVEYTDGGIAVAVGKGDNASLLALINDYIDTITTDGTFDAWLATATEQNAQLLAGIEAQ